MPWIDWLLGAGLIFFVLFASDRIRHTYKLKGKMLDLHAIASVSFYDYIVMVVDERGICHSYSMDVKTYIALGERYKKYGYYGRLEFTCRRYLLGRPQILSFEEMEEDEEIQTRPAARYVAQGESHLGPFELSGRPPLC